MEMREKERLDLSIIMPCLNEAATVGLSIGEAMTFLKKYGIPGEVLVVDNGSDDASAVIAREHGARLISQPRKGYGNALRMGIANSRGRTIIMGDCDSTYEFLHLEDMYQMLSKQEYHMVIGNRFAGGMEPGSMPRSHKWGVRFLSWLGRKKLRTDVYDFHCGLRGLTRQAAEQMEFETEGMEFATEMIAQAVRQNLSIGQVPVPLRRCCLDRKSKLRAIPDGLRHLIYIGNIPVKKGRLL